MRLTANLSEIGATARRLCSAATLAATAACAAAAQKAPAPAPAPADDAWFEEGRKTLAARMAVTPNADKAKNVILFVADGMGPTTVTAARIYDGQQKGMSGEENALSFERFPYVALAKTYNTDAQTPDSAGTMTAMVAGVKTKAGVLSISDAAERGDCVGAQRASVATIGELAEQAGMATGVISTARLTHATPAAVYAHSADRNWEADVDLPEAAQEQGCKDIAAQLIDFPYGDGLEIALGGGRRNFLPADVGDPEDEGEKGRRRDGRNLAEEWAAKSEAHLAVFDTEAFEAAGDEARILGLFERSHMEYEADREADAGGEPSLSAMTEKAIRVLSKDDDGYFLMVEAGRVDHAHHAGNAARALIDTQEFAEAVEIAMEMTDAADTLVIATADHGHTIAFQGYPARGNDILGLATQPGDANAPAMAGDGRAYTTLVYANGPGSVFFGEGAKDGERPEPTAEEVSDLSYRQQALIPAPGETHGGQDVAIYANGPHAYLFGGVVEQNYVFHVIDAALDLRARAEK